jgi:hypothetical protein
LLEDKKDVANRSELEEAIKDMWKIEYKENKIVDEYYAYLFRDGECNGKKETVDLIRRYLLVFKVE